MRRGLRLLVAAQRAQGEAEGRADAVERARHPLVRVTRCPVPPDPRAAALARAIEEMDDYGFGGGW